MARYGLKAMPVTWSKWPNWSERWFEDALAEARKTPVSAQEHRDVLRREIVFAVCFVESYLFEWARDTLGHDRLAVQLVMPGKIQGIKKRWRHVVEAVHQRKPFNAPLAYGKNARWSQFCQVVHFRDGLVHATASLPVSSDQSPLPDPYPDIEALDGLTPGWAVTRTVALVRQLHESQGSDPPDWLADP